MALKETVTVTRDVPSNIADLVYFVRYLGETRADLTDHLKKLTDDDLISAARSFWDRQHGED